MGSRKDQSKKDFLISTRKKNSPKLTPAPVWVIQKAGKRIFNTKQRRNWRETHLGEHKAKQEKQILGKRAKPNQKKRVNPHIKRMPKKRN